MPTAVGQTKDGRSSYRLGRDKTALSIFGKHTQEEIGISLSVLNNYFSKLGENDEPIYKNKKCTIRKGTLYVKPTTRGARNKVDNYLIKIIATSLTGGYNFNIYRFINKNKSLLMIVEQVMQQLPSNLHCHF